MFSINQEIDMSRFQVPLKVYLINKPVVPLSRGQEPQILETRLFKITLPSPLHLTAVGSKIEQLIPALQGKLYSIYWKDNDGDFIVVSSDEELTLAFEAFGGGTRRLYVALDQARQFPPAGTTPKTHVGVECDGCTASPIQGYRYKCVMCPDFDLCSTCEAKGVHSEHVMIRLPVPTLPNLDVSRLMKRRALHHWEKLASDFRMRSEQRSSSSSSDEDLDVPQCPFVEKRRRHHHKEKHDRHHKEHGRRHHHGHSDERERRRRCGEIIGRSFNAAAGAAAESAATVASSVANERNLQYLRNIGLTVAKLLDPLGIDVSVRARPDDPEAAPTTVPSTSSQAVPNPSNAGGPTSANVNTNGTPNGNGTNASEPIIPPIPSAFAAAIQQISESLAQQHVESEQGWAFVNPDDAINPRTSSAVSQTSPDVAAASSQTSPSSNTAPQPNLLVTRGLESLLSMGFTNDGNLLTDLLQRHNGDIHKVLENLHIIH